MQYFYAIVHKDRGSSYGVEFPDLPGCFSAADEMEDVVGNAIEAISLWMEDADPVVPRSLADIRDIAATALANGAFLVAIPWIQPADSVSRVNISLDDAVLRAIDTAAKQRRQSRSAFISDAATRLIAQG